MRGGNPYWRRLGPSVFFFWVVSLLPAEAPPSSAIPSAFWDPASAGPLPAWFGPVQSFSHARATVWRASIRPPPGPSHLAATLVFEETENGVARMIWQGSGRSVVLCPNLFEGAAPLHQRTILINRQTLGGLGQLVVESSGNQPILLRAEFSWVEPLVLAATGGAPPGLFLGPSGRIFPSEELQGGTAPSALTDLSRNRVVDAVLDPGPVCGTPHTPVRFLSTLTLPPSHGRVQARIAGLRPGEEPEIHVNGWRLPAVAVEVPGLDDPGYQPYATEQGPAVAFGGWRTAVALVPPGWLRRGENQIDWICPEGSAGMTMRSVRLQVSYDSVRAPSPIPSPADPVRETTSVSSVPALPPVSPDKRKLPQLRLGLSSSPGGLSLRPE